MPRLLVSPKAATSPLGASLALWEGSCFENCLKWPEPEILAMCPSPLGACHSELHTPQATSKWPGDDVYILGCPSRLSGPSSSAASLGYWPNFLPICLCPSKITCLAAESLVGSSGEDVSRKSKCVCLRAYMSMWHFGSKK